METVRRESGADRMPLNLAREDRKIAVGLGVLFGVALLLAGYMVSTDEGSGASPSSYSAGNNGSKAAFLLLQQTGYSPARWTDDPIKLSTLAPRSTLILVDPIASEERAVKAVRNFVKNGGHVLATGPSFIAFVPDHHIRGGVPHFRWKEYIPREPSDLTRQINSIKLAPKFYFDEESDDAPFGDGDEIPISRFSYGKGEVIWWSSFDPLSNSGIREKDNAQLLLNCLGAPGARPVLWDEYFHQAGKTVINSVVESPLRWGLLQALLVGILACLTYSRNFGPLRQSIVASRLAPMEFVETLAALYQKTGKPQIAVEIVYQHFRESLQRRFSIHMDANSDQAASAMATQLPEENPANLARMLSGIEAAINDPTLSVSKATLWVSEMHTLMTRLKLGNRRSE
jgi:hypothetical protein